MIILVDPRAGAACSLDSEPVGKGNACNVNLRVTKIGAIFSMNPRLTGMNSGYPGTNCVRWGQSAYNVFILLGLLRSRGSTRDQIIVLHGL